MYTTFTYDDITSNNIIIKLTSNDPILEDERIISILHLHEKQDRSSRYISLSPFVLQPTTGTKKIKYIFPIYRGIKCAIYNKIITYIGYFQSDYLDEDLNQMIRELPEYEFCFVSLHVDKRLFKSHKNVRCFPECDATELVEIVSNSQYILSRHIRVSNFDRFSGALSIAVSHRKPLILSSHFAEVYGLPAITYNYLFCETVDKIRGADYEAELDRLDKFVEIQTIKNKEALTELL